MVCARKGAGHCGQQQVLHRQALITHPACLHTTDISLHGPHSFFWSQMPGLDHGHFSLESSRVHLEMNTAEPAGPEASPAFWIPENDKQDNKQLWSRWCHSSHMAPGRIQSSKALVRWVKGRFCLGSYTKGSRAALPDINMLGTALKRGANGIGGQRQQP